MNKENDLNQNQDIDETLEEEQSLEDIDLDHWEDDAKWLLEEQDKEWQEQIAEIESDPESLRDFEEELGYEAYANTADWEADFSEREAMDDLGIDLDDGLEM